jgi:hypothetical protein
MSHQRTRTGRRLRGPQLQRGRTRLPLQRHSRRQHAHRSRRGQRHRQLRYGINNLGEVTGSVIEGGVLPQAFAYRNGTFTKLGFAQVGNRSEGRAINGLGQIVGFGNVHANATNRALIYTNGVWGVLPSLIGTEVVEAFGINDAGQIAGRAVTNGVTPRRALHRRHPARRSAHWRRGEQLRQRDQQRGRHRRSHDHRRHRAGVSLGTRPEPRAARRLHPQRLQRRVWHQQLPPDRRCREQRRRHLARISCTAPSRCMT